jgi:hypothetical protein
MHGRGLARAAAVAIVMSAPYVRADEKLACVAAADEAQKHRSAGRLRDARISLHTCARDVCPAIVRNDCTRWLLEVDGSLPSIVIRARDPRGQDITDVRVEWDGRLVAQKLDGLPIEVDPGRHLLTMTRTGSQTIHEEVLIHTGEKNRTFSVVLAPGDPAGAPAGIRVPESGATPSRGPAWILLGVTAAAAASFAYFGLRGQAEVADMRNECAGHCPADRVDRAHEKLLVADLSLGTAVVSAALATYFFVSASQSRSISAPAPAQQINVTPVFGGAFAAWVQRF